MENKDVKIKEREVNWKTSKSKQPLLNGQFFLKMLTRWFVYIVITGTYGDSAVDDIVIGL